MPEFYADSKADYQNLVHAHLDAIARGVRDSEASRAFLLAGTPFAQRYQSAQVLWSEQQLARDKANRMKGPFWSNYWYEPCSACTCRLPQSVSLEVDAIFFLRSTDDGVLALHVEMKRDHEPLSLGQAEAYRARAACFRDQRRVRKTLLPHTEYMTALFCGAGTDLPYVERHFDRVITHAAAQSMFPGYPA